MNMQDKIDYITSKIIDPNTEEAMVGALLTEVVKYFNIEVLDDIITKFEDSSE